MKSGKLWKVSNLDVPNRWVLEEHARGRLGRTVGRSGRNVFRNIWLAECSTLLLRFCDMLHNVVCSNNCSSTIDWVCGVLCDSAAHLPTITFHKTAHLACSEALLSPL